MEAPSFKHHYIPQCYLKRWTGPDCKLTVYERPHSKLSIRRRSRAATGWEAHLYSDTVERSVMGRVDQAASDALDKLVIADGDPSLTDADFKGWVSFLTSLLHRYPARMAGYKLMVEETSYKTVSNLKLGTQEEYEGLRGPDDPPTAEEYFHQNAPRLIEEHSDHVIGLLTFSEQMSASISAMRHTVFSPEQDALRPSHHGSADHLFVW